jgi:hypothetical protein
VRRGGPFDIAESVLDLVLDWQSLWYVTKALERAESEGVVWFLDGGRIIYQGGDAEIRNWVAWYVRRHRAQIRRLLRARDAW